jgi:DNA-binding transcriptional LysR family regulator
LFGGWTPTIYPLILGVATPRSAIRWLPDIASTRIGIELRHLRYYLAVVEELHFGRAAERLHVAQPAVSQAVRKLEDDLGLQLLHRTSRVVTPTGPGRVLAEEARRALVTVDRAIEAALRAGGTGAALRVGCVPHGPMERLQRFLTTLEERHPAVRANVTHGSVDEQVALLHNMELDIGIYRFSERQGIKTEPLFAGDPLMAFLPTGHPLAAKPVVTPGDVIHERMIVVPSDFDSPQCDDLQARLEASGYRFAAFHEAAGIEPRDLMLPVAEGRGVLLGPASLADTTQATAVVVCRPMEPTLFLPDVVVAWRADPPDHLRPILSAVREVARDLRGAARD